MFYVSLSRTIVYILVIPKGRDISVSTKEQSWHDKKSDSYSNIV